MNDGPGTSLEAIWQTELLEMSGDGAESDLSHEHPDQG
jgi:hypothetical protein